MFARGKTYTGLHFIKMIPEIMTLVPLQTGMWWRGTVWRLQNKDNTNRQ